MPLKNKDRIQAVLAVRRDPYFSGSYVDLFNQVEQADNTYVAPQSNQYQFEDNRGVYAPHPGHIFSYDKNFFSPYNQRIAQAVNKFGRGVDALKRGYRQNVPESFRTVVPGFSDVEDAMFVHDQFGKEGSWGGRAMAVGMLALPIVGSKAFKFLGKKTVKDFAFESIPKRTYKVSDNLETSYRSSHFLPEQKVYEFKGQRFTSEGTNVETKIGDLRAGRHFNNKITKQKFLDYGGLETDFNEALDNINPETLITHNPPSGASGVMTENRAFVWRNPYRNLESSEDLTHMKNTIRHEKYHQSKIVGTNRDESLLPSLYDDIEKLSGITTSNLPEGSFSKYINSPGEIYSRMGEIRLESGLELHEKFTQKRLEDAMGIKRNEAGKIISVKTILPSYKGNEKRWLEIMNYAPFVAGVTAVKISNRNNK